MLISAKRCGGEKMGAMVPLMQLSVKFWPVFSFGMSPDVPAFMSAFLQVSLNFELELMNIHVRVLTSEFKF